MLITKLPGFRFFNCPECDFAWRSPTTDHRDKNPMHCPECKEPTQSYRAEPQPHWRIDSKGRLVNQIQEVTPMISPKIKI